MNLDCKDAKQIRRPMQLTADMAWKGRNNDCTLGAYETFEQAEEKFTSTTCTVYKNDISN